MTNMIPSLPFPDPSDQSRAKRKWAPPRLTTEEAAHTASGKANPVVAETTMPGIFGPAS